MKSLVVLLSLLAAFASAQTSENATRPAIQADKVIASKDETIHLKALAPGTMKYAWSVSAGDLQPSGAEATWNLKGLLPGAYSAKVTIQWEDGRTSESSQTVVVASDTRSPRVSGRTFLPRGSKEGEGYGLYTYLLFGSPPTEETRPRYVQVVTEYLAQISALQEIEKLIGKDRINITYVPITASDNLALTPDWVLQHYDYGRAQVLMTSIPGSPHDGICLISVLQPLGDPNSFSSGYLLQDLSTTPAHLITAWMKLFLSQAAQDKPWDSLRTERFALQLRTGIAVLAVGLPEVRSALADWIAWKH